jgi:micrococcal nuclease
MLSLVRSLLVLALAAVLSACGPIDRAATRDTVPPGAGEQADVTVTRVVDGDTIHVMHDGDDVTIRLIGVDTPETVAPDQPVECYGPQASRFTTSELTGRRITLEFDRQLLDPFDRTLAYVWLGDELFNETLVNEGYAEAKTYPPNTRYQSHLDAAEDAARASDRGLWGAC